MRKVCAMLSLVGLLVGTLTELVSATLINEDFALGLTGWTTADIDTHGQRTSPSRSVAVVGAQAVLTTQGLAAQIPDITLSQETTIPALATLFRLDIGFVRGATDTPPAGFSLPDFVQVSYLDSVDAQFDHTLLGVDVNGAYDPTTLALLPLVDLGNGLFRFTTLIPTLAGRTGTIIVGLADQDDGFFSTATVDNVVIDVRSTVVPEPGTWLLVSSGCLALGFLTWRRRTAPRC